MSLKHFTLRESHDECRHIGTVTIDIDLGKEQAKRQLNEKVTQALNEHFDEECTLAAELDPFVYIGTGPHDVSFAFKYDGDDEEHDEMFEIEQTWLY